MTYPAPTGGRVVPASAAAAQGTVRGARAALTARGARKAPRTSTEAIVASASAAVMASAMIAQPRTRSSIHLPGVAKLFEIAAAEALGAKRQRAARYRVVHRSCPAFQLVPDVPSGHHPDHDE